jgi:membrane-associated phospholipid phosphatase
VKRGLVKAALTSALSESRPLDWSVAARPSILRRGEKVAIAYFVYTAVMVSVYGEPVTRCLVAWMLPLVLGTALALESRYSAVWSRVTRDWALLGLILIAYWQVDWLGSRSMQVPWQQTWIGWDRYLLHEAGLSGAIEAFGAWLPSILEAVYLCLYAIPPICMGVLYVDCRRDRIDRYLTTLLLGTFCAYALLPHFPTISPRIAFPGQDLPSTISFWRGINIWLLDHCDISASVFPSGHVAVAFSSAFGLLRAVPERRWACLAAFAAAIIVFTATIYGRYHYAADGLASFVITVAVWRILQALDRNA